MSNYSSLKATINANVKQNGNQEITGAIMNSVLNAMVDSLGTGYQYKGVATPATNPGTPDYNVFYLASEAGTYTNFGGIVIGDNEVAALVYNGTWSKQTTGAATASEVSQLAQDVDGYDTTTEETIDVTDIIVGKSWNTNNNIIPSVANLVDSETGAVTYLTVQPGEKYRVYGNDGGTKYTRLWAIGDSSRNVLTKADFPINARVEPVELTMPENASILIVIYNNYSSATDKTLKVITTTVHTDGLKDKVEELEAEDIVISGRVTAVEQDVADLEQEVPKKKDNWANINTADLTSIPMVINTTPDGGVYKWTSNRSTTQQFAMYRHTRIKCTEGDKFLIKANSTYPCTYAWLTSYEATYQAAVPLVTGTTPITISKGSTVVIEAPAGAEFLYLIRTLSSGTEYLPETTLRLTSYAEAEAVPTTFMYLYYDSVTGKIVSQTASSSALRAVKVKKGDIIHFYTDYTAGVNQGRVIYLGFCAQLPADGVNATIIDAAENYGAKVTYDDYYVAPSDGYFFMTTQYGNTYYTTYSFKRVLIGADTAHPLRDEKILVFGDSILSFTDSFANNRGFVEFLAEYLNATVIRGSIGGTRLIPRASGAFQAFDISNLIHSWVTDDWTTVDAALESEPSYAPIINNLKAIRPGEITTIIIDGGGNDLSNPSLTFGDSADADIFDENPTNDTLYGAINFIMRDLFTANPHIKIFWVNGLVGFSGSGLASRTAANWSDNRSVAVDGVTYTLKEYYAKIYEQVEKWKVPLISMADICINPVTFSQFFYDNDNTHPYKGFYRMASIVASQLVAKMFQ